MTFVDYSRRNAAAAAATTTLQHVLCQPSTS